MSAKKHTTKFIKPKRKIVRMDVREIIALERFKELMKKNAGKLKFVAYVD
jgi:hypothetical protein